MTITTIRSLVAGRKAITIDPGAAIIEAARLLDQHNIGALAVTDKGRLVGIVTERDLIRRAVSRDLSMQKTLVRDIMTAGPRTIDEWDSPADAMAEMVVGGFRHLPVLSDGKLVAMLSFRDIPTMTRQLVERYGKAVGHPAMA